jgi:GT2 family glycosyltransferase
MFKKNFKAISIEIALRLAIINTRLFGDFNKDFYLKTNKDVALSDQDPIRHFLSHGHLEGRTPFPENDENPSSQSKASKRLNNLLFVKLYYSLLKLTNPQLEDEHWENFKIIKKSGLFDTRYYLENNKDVLESCSDPLMHYVAFGFKEGRNPNPGFDTVAYAIQHGIPSYSNINPFVQYILHFDASAGNSEIDNIHERPDHSIPFDANYYLKKYPDLANAKIDAYEHFLSHGLFEGRDSDPSHGGYAEWRKSFVLNPQRIKQTKPIATANLKITVCLIYEGQNDDEIKRTVDSLGIQGENFNVIVAGSSKDTKPLMDQLSANTVLKPGNIKASPVISDLFNKARKEKEFISFLTVGDQLLPGAMRSVKTAIQTHPQALLHYSDEEIADTKNAVIKPLFKGGLNPDLQREKDYIGNFLTLSTDLKGINSKSDFEVWAVNRFLLTNQILDQLDSKSSNHIPHILYRRNYAEQWPKDLLVDMANLIQGFAKTPSSTLASVTPSTGSSLRLKYETPKTKNKVSIVIPTRNGIEVLKPCIDSIQRKTDFRNFELIIIDNGSDEQSAIRFLESLEKEHANVTVITHDQPFNYSELNNLGVDAASGEFLVFLNNDIEVISPDWLDELISQAARPEIGVVGSLLLFPDGTVQHAGVILGIGGVAAHAFSGWDPDSDEFAEFNHTRRVSSVTGACMAMRREVFEAVGGFDEDNLPVDFNDVDLCLRVSEAGLGILFTPQAKLYHHESKTRVSHKANTAEAERFALEVQWMQERWFSSLTDDPYYSPNHSLGLPGYKLSWPPRERTLSVYQQEVPNLDLYVTHSNLNRAKTIVKTMGKAPHTLSKLAHDISTRKPGLSVIILNLDKPEFIVPLINSMKNAEEYFNDKGFNFEILIGDTGSTDTKVLDMYKSAPPFVKILNGLKYQFSRCNNQVFAQLSAYDTVLFLNNDIELSGNAAATLFEMFKFLNETPEAGTVGAQLLFPDKSIQHAGIGVFETGPLRGFVHHPDAHKTAYPKDIFPRKMWAVTGACLMMRSSDFVASDGFDEDYRTECQDAALCLEVRRRGLQSYVLSPEIIFHFENGTREKGSEDWPDRQRFMRHWSAYIDMELRELVQ